MLTLLNKIEYLKICFKHALQFPLMRTICGLDIQRDGPYSFPWTNPETNNSGICADL